MELHEATWLAALLDGEGTISLSKSISKKEYQSRAPKRGFTWNMRVSIVNTCIPLLLQAQKLAGGKLGSLRDDRPNRQPSGIIFFNAEEQDRLLEAILPHLIAKKHHAELYLEARDLMKLYRGLGHTEDLTVIRDKRMEAIYRELRILNARGSDGKVLAEQEVQALSSDPRLYTREKFNTEMEETLRTREQRIKENQLRLSREWKIRNKDKITEYRQRTQSLASA